jgi:hypothetical protein
MQVQVVDQHTHPPKCHSFVGLDRQIGSSPPALLKGEKKEKGKKEKFYIYLDVTHTHTQTQTQTQTRHDTSSTSCRTYFSKLQDFLYKCRQILSNSGIHMQCEIVLSRFVTVGDLKLLNMYEYVVFLCASKFIGLHIIIKGKPHKVKKK